MAVSGKMMLGTIIVARGTTEANKLVWQGRWALGTIGPYGPYGTMAARRTAVFGFWRQVRLTRTLPYDDIIVLVWCPTLIIVWLFYDRINAILPGSGSQGGISPAMFGQDVLVISFPLRAFWPQCFRHFLHWHRGVPQATHMRRTKWPEQRRDWG